MGDGLDQFSLLTATMLVVQILYSLITTTVVGITQNVTVQRVIHLDYSSEQEIIFIKSPVHLIFCRIVLSFSIMNLAIKKYLLLSICAFATFIGKCDTYRIKFTSDVYPVTLKLYRYENNFKKDFIDQIELKHDSAFYREIPEIDSYVVLVDGFYGFYFFIWDGDVQIDLNTKAVYKSTIKNSPSTNELDNFRITSQRLVFKEIRDLDTLLINMDKKGVKINNPLYYETKIKRNELMNQGPSRYEAFVRNYLKENPKSYVAIYRFSELGLVPDKDELLILRNMPVQLQKNHRYIKIMDR